MDKSGVENEFLAILLAARQKGMSSRQFFSLAEATLKHMKGIDKNVVLSKIIDGEATTPEEVESMIAHLKK